MAYFYCARNPAEPQRADPDEILRSIVKQLSCTKPDLPIRSPIPQEYEKRKEEAECNGSEPTKLSVDESTEIILALTEINPVIIIIDGLDECDTSRRYELFKAFETIINESANLVKIFVSSRDDTDIVCNMEDSSNILINARDNSDDIHRFVHSEVERSIADKRLLNGQVSDDLKSHIIKTLVEGAEGM
jgi:KAP family P-loop domain